MNEEKQNIGKKRIITGALAGAMVLSGFAISAATPAAAKVKEDANSKKVILYDKDAELSSIAAKVSNTKNYTDYKTGQYQEVSLNGKNITFKGDGATVSGSDLLINSPGTYVLSGTLNDGAIIVDSSEVGNVTLVLNNANITCKNGAPIYVKNCGKNVIISMPEGTENTITDGKNYTYEYKLETTDVETGEASVQPNAAIFSKDDLKINGKGKLTVNANYNDGIVGKDDVEIAESTLVINAEDDGIVGKDSIRVGSGNITIKAQGDGMKSTNSEDSSKGYVAIADGSFNITSGNDGIQAETILLTLGGDFKIKTGEGAFAGKSSQSYFKDKMSPNWDQQSPENTAKTVHNKIEKNSAKALKAGTKVVLQDGNFNIDSEDDAVHSNDYTG